MTRHEAFDRLSELIARHVKDRTAAIEITHAAIDYAAAAVGKANASWQRTLSQALNSGDGSYKP